MPAETATLSPVASRTRGTSSRIRSHGALVGAADGEHEAELRGPERRGLGRGRQHLVGVEERGGLHRGVEARRLGAEVAVLGAAPGLGREDALDLDRRPAPGQPDLVGQRGQCRHRLVGHDGQRCQLLGVEGAALVEQGAGGRGDQAPQRVGGPLGGRGRTHGTGARRAPAGTTVLRVGATVASPGIGTR